MLTYSGDGCPGLETRNTRADPLKYFSVYIYATFDF